MWLHLAPIPDLAPLDCYHTLPTHAQNKDLLSLKNLAGHVAPERGCIFLTVVPFQGLDKVTTANMEATAQLLRSYEQQGVRFILRFAHEMNGSWYGAYSMQPGAYKRAWATMAAAMRSITCDVKLMWAPNDASGYPWGGQPPAGELAALDTNGNGRLDKFDDPYGPFWPDDPSTVDWVSG